MKRSERSMILWVQIGDLQMPRAPCCRKNNPDAACIHEIERTERKSSVGVYNILLLIRKEIKQSLRASLCYFCSCLWVLLVYFRRPGRFWFLRSFWEHNELWMIDHVLALANSACLLALRSERHIVGYAALCRADCAVLCLRQMLDNKRVSTKKAHTKKKEREKCI